MPRFEKKAATVMREVEQELADTNRRIEELRIKRNAALLDNDTAALDVIEVTQARLQKAATRQSERLRLLQAQAQQEETAEVQKRRQALRDRFAKRLAQADADAVELQAAMATVLRLYRKIIAAREDCRSQWPAHNSHTNAAAGTPDGAALSAAAVKTLLANHLYKISADPWLGGQAGEVRELSLPGAQCPRLDWLQTPDRISSFADALRMASKFAVDTMTTTLDPLKALPGQAVAPVDSAARTDAERKLAALLGEQAKAAADTSPEGEQRYFQIVSELAALSNEQTGANKQ